jgi:PAS domain-containing protein
MPRRSRSPARSVSLRRRGRRDVTRRDVRSQIAGPLAGAAHLRSSRTWFGRTTCRRGWAATHSRCVVWFSQIWAAVLLAAGVVVLTSSVVGMRGLVRARRTPVRPRDARVLFGLVAVFIVGYAAVLTAVVAGRIEALLVLVGALSVLGAMFVRLLVRVGQRSLQSAVDTRLSEHQLSELHDALGEALALVDPDGRIRVVNRRLCELVLRPASALLGRPVGELLGDDLAHAVPRDRDDPPYRGETNLRCGADDLKIAAGGVHRPRGAAARPPLPVQGPPPRAPQAATPRRGGPHRRGDAPRPQRVHRAHRPRAAGAAGRVDPRVRRPGPRARLRSRRRTSRPPAPRSRRPAARSCGRCRICWRPDASADPSPARGCSIRSRSSTTSPTRWPSTRPASAARSASRSRPTCRPSATVARRSSARCSSCSACS